MITLITGGPGSGKTAYAVNYLINKISSERVVYQDGITDLSYPSQEIDPNEWHICAAEGSYIIIDEAQRIWRPTGISSQIPPSITELETHRHKGIDFLLITQHPSLIHQNVRRLVSKHVHIESSWSGRKLHEWSSCKADPTRTTDAVTRLYKLPSSVFEKYKSAEVHTKIKRKLPISAYALLVILAILAFAGFEINTRVNEVTLPQSADVTTAPLSIQHKLMAKKSETFSVVSFVPLITDYPESAPIYDQVRKVITFPKISGCVSSLKRGCKCYNQQGSVYKTSEKICKEYIAHSRFDPYRVDPKMKIKRASGEGSKRATGDRDRVTSSYPLPVQSDPYRQMSDNYVRVVPN